MIKELKGDLIFESWDASISTIIAHVVNDRGLMGAGFAKQLKDYYPDVYRKYRKYCGMGVMHGNNFYSITERSPNITVANMFAQFGLYNRLTNPVPLCEVSLRNCIRSLFTRAASDNVAKIHMPKLGAGLARGNWSRIKRIIEEEHAKCLVEKHFDANVVIWELDTALNPIYKEDM